METQNSQILHLRLPKGMVFTEDQLMEFSQINHKKVETMFEDGFFTLIIHLMGNFAKAATFIARITTKLVQWNDEKSLGNVYSETFMFQVKEHTYREGGISFISFNKTPKDKQLEWQNSSAKNSATLLLEISSTTANANINLKKTVEFWIPFGTNYVIVVNLEERRWHFFKNSTLYSTHSFSEKFVAPADLPDLVLDFEEIARKCGF